MLFYLSSVGQELGPGTAGSVGLNPRSVGSQLR